MKELEKTENTELFNLNEKELEELISDFLNKQMDAPPEYDKIFVDNYKKFLA
jgi:hypothetical protein